MEMSAKPQQKKENLPISHSKQQESNGNTASVSAKWQSNQKEKTADSVKMNFEGEGHFHMMELQEPSPITYLQQQNNFSELVVIGRHWSPKKEEMENQEVNIDEVL